MKKFSLKALGASLLTLGLVVAGAAAPAQAGTLTSASVTATGTIGTSGTNAYPITVAATTVTASGQFNVILPTGWTANFGGGPNCSAVTYTGIVIAGNGCSTTVAGVVQFYGTDGSGNATPIPVGTSLTITFPVGKLNTAAGRDFTLSSVTSGTTLDSSTVTLGANSSSTVSFNANGGSGAMADQSASTATNLTANSFSRAGFTFAGWATSPTGTVAYADGASYTFASSTTLYAVWTPTLATTGFDGVPYLAGGLSLAVVGGSLMLIARRKVTN